MLWGVEAAQDQVCLFFLLLNWSEQSIFFLTYCCIRPKVGTKVTTSISKQILKHQEEINRLIKLYNGCLRPNQSLTSTNLRNRLKATDAGRKFSAMTQWCLKQRAVEEVTFVRQEARGALDWILKEERRLEKRLLNSNADEKSFWAGKLSDTKSVKKNWENEFRKIM